MNEFILQKKKTYCSWSQINLWRRARDQYRLKYFYGQNLPFQETPETLFGKEIAKKLEENHESLAHVPRYSKMEYKIFANIGGVNVLGYLDSFDPEKKQFIEYKTGHVRFDGKAPWSQFEVEKHDQLVLYSLLVEVSEKKVKNKADLIWLETVKKPKTVEFDGNILIGSSYDLELTGRMERFTRIISKDERKWMRNEIIKVWKEIEEDYERLSNPL